MSNELKFVSTEETATFLIVGPQGPSGAVATEGYVGDLIAGAASKTTPVDADSFGLSDSEAAGALKKLTWENIKIALQTTFSGVAKSSNYGYALSSIVPLETTGSLYIKKTTASRFEISVPDNANGRYIRHRFDNDSVQYLDASPSDVALGLSRPYQHTLTDSIFLGDAYYGIAASSAATNGSPVTSSSYLYLKNAGDYFEFTVTSSSQLRISFLSTTNAGTFSVTIDGRTDLINLLPVVGGVALIDSYAASGSSVSLMIADNLPLGSHLVRFTVVGKNPASSDTRMYLDNTTSYGLRVFPAWSNLAVAPIETSRFYFKIGGSGVNYALAFRPLSMTGAPTPFIGGVHGYENLTKLTVTCDGVPFDIAAASVSDFRTCLKQICIQQTSDIYHPSDPGVIYASVSSIWAVGRGGITHSHKWTIKAAVHVANGYPDMFTVYGANQGGPGGPLLGWADRVILGGHGGYALVNGDSVQYGAKLTNEVVFYGTPYDASVPTRNVLSGNLACVVNFADINRDFAGFVNPTAINDGIFIQDRATFRKLYLNAFRNFGTMNVNYEFTGAISARFIESNGIYNVLAMR